MERRMRGRIDGPVSGFGAEGLRGAVRNGRVSVRWHSPWLGSTFPAVFRGVIVDGDSGCRIEGRISRIRLLPFLYGLCIGWAVFSIADRLPVVNFSAWEVAILAAAGYLVGLLKRVSYTEKQKLMAELRCL